MYPFFGIFDHFHMSASQKWHMTNDPRKGPGFVQLSRFVALSYHFSIIQAFSCIFFCISNHHTFHVFSVAFWAPPGANKARTTMGVPGLRIRNRTRPGCGGRWLHDGCPSPAMRRLVWAVLHLLLPVSAYEAFLGAIFCWWEVMGPSLRNIGFPCEGNALAISERCRIENRKVMTENLPVLLFLFPLNIFW